jgi:hypothetical protein
VLAESLVLAAFLLLIVAFTWPAITKTFSEFSSLDPTYTAWALWWVKHQLVALANPWHTDDMFAPQGVYLAFHNLSPLAGTLLAPLTATLGAGPTTNLTKFAAPVGASYATYRLALRLGLGRWTAFATGALYGCSAAMTWRADGHFNLAAGAIFPPLALLTAVRFRQSLRTRDALLVGLTLGLAALTDHTYFAFSAAIVAAYGLATGYVDGAEARRRMLRGAGIAACVLLVVASPQLVMMARQRAAGEYEQNRELLAQAWVQFGASPTTLLGPAPPFEKRTDLRLGSWAHRPGEGLSNYGWGLLILASAGAALAFRRRLTKWLIALWLALTLLALGPSLVLGDQTFTPLPLETAGQKLSLLMPYSYLVQVPGLSELRVAARFGLLAMLPLALLAGLGIRELASRPGRLPRVALVAVGAMALLELGGTIRFTGPMHYDRLYAPVEANDSRSIVVDLPLSWASGERVEGRPFDEEFAASPSMPMLRATQHGHPVAWGFAARIGLKTLDELERNRFYTDLLVLQGGSVFVHPVPRPPDPRAGGVNARQIGVRWVTVWPGVSPRVLPYLRRAGFEQAAEEKGALLFGRTRTPARP